MQEKYNKYTKPIMDELEKKFKFITKKKDGSWVVQSNKNSFCEGFFVNTTIFGYITMSGDYNSIMVRPHGNEEALPNWMAGATTLSYFAEKVHMANQYHKCKEYNKDVAKEYLSQIKELLVDDIEEITTSGRLEKEKEFDQLVNSKDLTIEHEYWNLISEIESEFELYDLYEYNPSKYTDQIKWQHKCLIFWANKVLNNEFIKEK